VHESRQFSGQRAALCHPWSCFKGGCGDDQQALLRRRRVVIGCSATGFGVCFLFFFSAESVEKESVKKKILV
jgi:hypothetical protein